MKHKRYPFSMKTARMIFDKTCGQCAYCGQDLEFLCEGHAQMLVTVCKQKLGVDNVSKWVYFDPALNQLDRLEMKTYKLEDDYD